MVRLLGRRPSLSRRLLLSTLLLVTTSVLLLALTSLSGVYRSFDRLGDRQQTAYCDTLEALVRGRLVSAADMLDGISSGLSRASEEERPVRLTQRHWGAAVDIFSRLVLMSRDGHVISTYPVDRGTVPVASAAFAAASVTTFADVGDSNEGEREVWAFRSVPGMSDHVIAGRLRTSFVGLILEETTPVDLGECAFLCDADGNMISGSGIDAETARSAGMGEMSASDGRVSFHSSDGWVTGRYRKVAVPGLDWTVVAAEPSLHRVAATWDALKPAALMALVVAGMAMIAASISARLLVAPLQELEHRAQRAASGAAVRPIEVRREDEVGRLVEAINALTLRLNALHDIARLLHSAGSTDQVLDSILSSVRHIARSAQAAVLLVDPVSGDLVVERADAAVSSPPGKRLCIEESPVLGQALRAYGPVSLPSDREPVSVLYESAGEVMAVPLDVGGEKLGLLLVSDPHRSLSDAEIETLGTFGAQAATALRNSRLFETEAASRVEAEALRDVAESLSNPADLDSALESVADVARRLLGAKRALVVLRDRELLGLHRQPEHPAAEERLLDVLRLTQASGPHAGGLVIEDVEKGSTAGLYLAEDGVSSVILLPLLVQSEVVGALGLEYPEGDVWFGEARLRLGTALAMQISLALENASLLRQAHRRSANLDMLFRISQVIGSSLDPRVVLERVLDVVQKILFADAVSLMSYEPGKRALVTAMARGFGDMAMVNLRRKPGEDVPGEVYSSGRPRLVGRLDGEADGLVGLAARQGLQTMLAVPLRTRGRSIGVLTVFSKRSHAYGEEDVELLSTFASQAALALDTAEAYGREHRVSQVLQSSILPERLPVIDGIEADSAYEPASRDADIGGDYYDVFETPGGAVMLSIGDVCGKGVQAATKTSMLRYSVRALASTGMGPAEVMREVNRVVAETDDASDICTLWLGRLEPEQGVLHYASGGHPAGLLLLPDGGVERLAATGPLLGAAAEAEFDERKMTAPRGSMVLLYTDGVTEARRGNTFFGEERVCRAVEDCSDTSQVTDRLLDSLRRFAPGDLRDDVAILAVKLSGGERQGPRSSLVRRTLKG